MHTGSLNKTTKVLVVAKSAQHLSRSSKCCRLHSRESDAQTFTSTAKPRELMERPSCGRSHSVSVQFCASAEESRVVSHAARGNNGQVATGLLSISPHTFLLHWNLHAQKRSGAVQKALVEKHLADSN